MRWLLLALLLPAMPVYGAQCAIPDEVAVNCLVGEAASEGLKGMTAVGEVLRTRNSTHGFYGCKAKHIATEPEWVFEVARKAWKDSASSNLTKGATHFEGMSFKTPYWAKEMKVVAVIGQQRFYRRIKHG